MMLLENYGDACMWTKGSYPGWMGYYYHESFYSHSLGQLIIYWIFDSVFQTVWWLYVAELNVLIDAECFLSCFLMIMCLSVGVTI